MLNQDNHSTVSGSIGGLVGGGTAALTEDFQNLEDDETLSVAGTEYSEAPSVARSYTISHSAQVSIWYIYTIVMVGSVFVKWKNVKFCPV